MRLTNKGLWTISCALALAACSTSENKPGGGGGSTGSAGVSGAAGAAQAGQTGAAGSSSGGGSAGNAGNAGNAGMTGTAGSGVAGASGGAGGASAGTTGAAGSGGAAGGSTGASPDGGAKDAAAGEVAGPVTTAGCAGKTYPLCIDFESGIDGTTWTGGNANAIVTDEVAHGTHAYHLYSDKAMPVGGILTTTKLGTLKDKIWGRFYIHFKPGAPGGHGNLVAASDGVWSPDNYHGNWYEIGWQFDGIMGVFHPLTGERPLRSKPYILDQWYCVELLFDGTVVGDGTVQGVQASPRWWIDGQEAQYYTPNQTKNPTTPANVAISQFKSITVGWKPYAGLGLMLPDQNKIIDTRLLNDAWIDDVAFDTQRIGCIQ
jgi:hypothetical protein